MELEVTKLNPNVQLGYKTEGAAGLDLSASILHNLHLNPGNCVLIPTGISINIKDSGCAGLILPRSGLGHYKGLVLGNTVGLIDSDYQGEIKVSAYNRGNDVIIITPMMRIAQLVIIPVIQVDIKETTSYTRTTRRGTKGFGSTDYTYENNPI